MLNALFILKVGGLHYGKPQPAGLANSARFVSDMLNQNGITSEVAHAVDNNDIDRLVTEVRPDTVIIEALWVVPEKFDVLKKLHPAVRWIVRIHSEMPFLALEGIAFEWLAGYRERGVEVAVNSEWMQFDLGVAGFPSLLLPNYYPTPWQLPPRPMASAGLCVGCFGAIRPLKNTLAQAIAAIYLADGLRKTLYFSVNEAGADPAILKNLNDLFAGSKHHFLVRYPWLPHDLFLKLLRRQDLAMQCSLSESFNIVSADAVCCGVPIVVSEEVSWASKYSKADPNDIEDITFTAHRALTTPPLPVHNLNALRRFSEKSENIWRAL